MTTIAYDGETLASDGMMTSSDVVMGTQIQKIFQPKANQSWTVNGENAIALAVAGQVSAIRQLQAALSGDSDLISNATLCAESKFPKGLSFNYIVIAESGAVYMGGQTEDSELAWISEVDVPIAIGSGSDFAMGAMAAGASAVGAVGIATRYDTCSGGKIQSIKISKSPITD
ncbi:hypothetical protein pEaSNUABM9_00092 [Erwinia phage pEa_SNUABM_9]|nr:hypothetical protein pEaSNUABM9_00092 [Erwinia phage pEa_SNUABM_9]